VKRKIESQGKFTRLGNHAAAKKTGLSRTRYNKVKVGEKSCTETKKKKASDEDRKEEG